MRRDGSLEQTGHKIQSMTDKESSADPPDHSKQDLPFKQQEPVPQGSKDTSSQENEGTKDLAKQVHWLQHATFWSQVGLGIVAIVALWIYYGQLKAMQDQLWVMSLQMGQTQRMFDQSVAQTRASQQSAAAAISAAATANKALNESVAGERPYLTIRPIEDFQISDGKQIRISLELFNWGRRIAERVTVQAKIVFGEGSYQSIDKYVSDYPKHPQLIDGINVIPSVATQISGLHVARNYITIDSLPFKISKEGIQYVASHEFSVTGFGKAWYTDTRGGYYWTEFCFTKFLSGATADCPGYNHFH
jgi:hypothetical protein